jgi:hypothetical protein
MQALKLGSAVLTASCIMVWSGTALAGGYGFFLEYGRNIAAPGGDISAELDYLNAELINQFGFGFPESDVLDLLDRNEFAIGFSMDTNVAADRLFNYRLDVGYHRSAWVDDLFATVSGFGSSNGVMLNNVFGFGVLRTSAVRVWLGPAIRMNFDVYPDAELFDYQLGVGPQLGINLNTGSVFTIVLSSAYNYKWGWFLDTSVLEEGVTSHRDHYVSVNLSFLFRSSGDQF